MEKRCSAIGLSAISMQRLSSITRYRTVISLLCLCFAAGCSKEGPTRYKVTGKVTLNGKPAPAFEIFFQPDASKGNSGPGAAVKGRNGVYETRTSKGVTYGPHLVSIVAFDGIPNAESKDGNAVTAKPHQTTVTIPAKDSEQNFDVPASCLVK
jgi:hypothetical protein